MKKIIGLLIGVFLSFSIVNANEISSIDMEIIIGKDGTAYITEHWKASTISSKGTEFYKYFGDLGESEIKNFKVSMLENYFSIGEERKYLDFQFIDNWDVDAKFSDKKYKYGMLNVDDGIELCWGITDYSLSNEYKLTYEITNFVVNTIDAQMIYWTLIPELSSPPKNYQIVINADYFGDNYEINYYGQKNKDDYIYPSSNTIIINGDNGLESGEYFNILLKFPSGAFDAKVNLDKDFEYYYKQAEHRTSKVLFYIEVAILFIIVLLPLVIFSYYVIKNEIKRGSFNKNFENNRKKYVIKKEKYSFKKVPRKIPRNVPYFREIPCDEDILYAYFVAKMYKLVTKKVNMIAIYLLKWKKDKLIRINKNDKKKIVVKFLVDKLSDKYAKYDVEAEFFKKLFDASTNNVLTEDGFKKYAKRFSKVLLSLEKNTLKCIKKTLVDNKLIVEERPKKRIFYITMSMYDDAYKIAGLKKFLINFANMDEKLPIEVHLWEEYLIFAEIFGIADKVSNYFREFYPDLYKISLEDGSFNSFDHINSISRTIYNSAIKKSRTRSTSSSYSSSRGSYGGGGSFGGGYRSGGRFGGGIR